jgi:hypothetical protein
VDATDEDLQGDDRLDILNLCGLRADQPSFDTEGVATALPSEGGASPLAGAAATGDVVDAVEGEFWTHASSELLRSTMHQLLNLRAVASLTAATAAATDDAQRRVAGDQVRLTIPIASVAWFLARGPRDRGTLRRDHTSLALTMEPVVFDLPTAWRQHLATVSDGAPLQPPPLQVRVWLAADAAAPRRCVAGPSAVLRHLHQQQQLEPTKNRVHHVGPLTTSDNGGPRWASESIAIAASAFAPILAPVCGRAGRRLLRTLGALGVLQLVAD